MRPKYDPGEMALRGRIGAYQLHASRDAGETTRQARAAFHDAFERMVDPQRELPERERLRRAEAARRAHYARLARLSAVARKARRSGRSDTD